MFTDWRMGRKRKLRGSLFSQWMVRMLKWKQAQCLDWGDFRFWSSLKGKWLVCGVAYLHFMSIILLIWATVLFYSQFLGTSTFPLFPSCYLLVQFYPPKLKFFYWIRICISWFEHLYVTDRVSLVTAREFMSCHLCKCGESLIFECKNFPYNLEGLKVSNLTGLILLLQKCFHHNCCWKR